jgi:hypothetical protein
MLSVVFHQLVPPSLYGGQTAFSVLSKIDRALAECQHAAAAAAVLDQAKPDLYTLLRTRFETPLAQALIAQDSQPLPRQISPPRPQFITAIPAVRTYC